MGITSTKTSTSPKGLLTEFSEITFPEEATVDELNCVIATNGKLRTRRKGAAPEDNNTLSSFTITETTPTYESTWYNVGGVANLEYLVVQTGSILRFYDKSSQPLSSGEKTFTIDLTTVVAANGVSISENRAETASLDGVLVVAHPACDLFYVSYDRVADTVSTTLINPKVRDFEYLGDDKTVYFTEGAESNIRKYDTFNSGWTTDAYDEYVGNRNLSPPLTHSFFSGKDTLDNFSVSEFRKVFTGNSLSGNGRFILDFFSKNRETKVSGAGIEVENSRFRTVEAFAGRFWYSGLDSQKHNGKILFSKVIVDVNDYETCYQVNDPTSELISDLLDSDGGEINIPEAFGIRKLHSFGSNLIVFADNGIWLINGVDGVFKATEFSVQKISSVGILDSNTFVEVEGIPFWWSKTGIHTVEIEQVSAQPREISITENTIKTFWENIGTENQLASKGVYDEVNREIVWCYPSVDESNKNKFNRFLVFNLELGSFTPWEIKDPETSNDYVVGLFFNPFVTSSSLKTSVEVESEEVEVLGVEVTVNSFFSVSVDSSEIKLLIRDGSTGKLTVGSFSSPTFKDWEEANYESFFVPTPITMDSWALDKSPLYVVTYFEQTETGFDLNSDGSFTLTNPSGCLVSVSSDFSNTFGPTQKAYRLKRLPYVNENNLTFTYPEDVIVNRTKLRGRGKVLKIKFSSEEGKDFQMKGFELLGYLNEQI